MRTKIDFTSDESKVKGGFLGFGDARARGKDLRRGEWKEMNRGN